MRKFIYKNEEIDKIILDESLIQSIRWIYKNYPIIEIEIDWCGQENLKNEMNFLEVQTKLIFEYADNMDVNFKYSGAWNSGALEITTFSYIKNLNSYIIEFKFDFSPVGYLKFNCTSFYFEIIE